MKPKLRKPRAVRGRRDAVVDGAAWRFELQAGGVVLWRKGTRRKFILTFPQLADAGRGQLQLL